MKELLLSSVVMLVVLVSPGLGEGYNPGYPPSGYGQQQRHQQGYGYQQSYTYHEYKKPSKKCYQCAYSPPKTYYDKKVVVEKHEYGQQHKGYGSQGGYGEQAKGYGQHGGYSKKTVIPVARTVYGGWDKCLGPFDHYQAKDFGVDVWDCHSNCYTRKDPNGDIFRGCYKGEFGVNPYAKGCSYQAGSLWCFCEGDKCNNEAVGSGGYH